MIQDLGLHALTPLMGLEHSIGTIDVSNLQGIRVAYCEEYKAAAKERGVPEEYVGESYAELDLCTGKNVPVRVRLGKYVENGQNQRRIIIVGTRGTVLYDMTNNVLAFQRGDKTDGVTPLLESDKTGKVVPKYLAVLRAGMEFLEGRNPFTFNPMSVAYEAQGIVLRALNLSQTSDTGVTYKQGAMHETILKR